jgi:hypothetical protein
VLTQPFIDNELFELYSREPVINPYIPCSLESWLYIRVVNKKVNIGGKTIIEFRFAGTALRSVSMTP